MKKTILRRALDNFLFYLPIGGMSSEGGDGGDGGDNAGGDGDGDGDAGDEPKGNAPNVIPPPKKSDDGDGDLATKFAKLERENAQLRQEHGRTRVNAKEKAAQDARDQQMKEIGKILGLVKDGDDSDPTKLQEKITGYQSEVADRDRRLAVFELAGKAEGDPNKLLKWGPFLESIKELEPTDLEGVEKAIKTAIDAEPFLKAAPAQAAGASGANHSGGTGEKRKVPNLSLSDAVSAALPNN